MVAHLTPPQHTANSVSPKVGSHLRITQYRVLASEGRQRYIYTKTPKNIQKKKVKDSYLRVSGSILDRLTLKPNISNIQMILLQSKHGVRKVPSVIKLVDQYTPNTDFQTTHARCPWARFAVCSFQTSIHLAWFTVQNTVVHQSFGNGTDSVPATESSSRSHVYFTHTTSIPMYFLAVHKAFKM